MVKLRIVQKDCHRDVVSALNWTPTNELFTCSDDKTIFRWNIDGEVQGEVCRLDCYVTDMSWFPSIGKQTADLFAVGCSDGIDISSFRVTLSPGTFRLFTSKGREEKTIQAHTGAAVTKVRWNHDGSTLATAGEDGLIKIWSRAGMLRSPLAQNAKPVYSLAWSPDGTKLLYSVGNDIIIKTIKGNKQLQWKAHDGVVLAADWNPVNNLIVSCGEDRKYKVWDVFGRQLYQSPAYEHSVTAVSWSPNGEYFAVGYYNTLRLCDKTGWSCNRQSLETGSIFAISWTADSTNLAAAGGTGKVVHAQFVERTAEWENFEVALVDGRTITVQDMTADSPEQLVFRDRVIEFSLGFGYLVVSTVTQCFVYPITSLQTPFSFDLAQPANLLVQSSVSFALVDSVKGIQVFNYEGRVLCNVRYAGLRGEYLSKRMVALSPDTVAVLDQGEVSEGKVGTESGQLIHLFDSRTGKPLGKPVRASLEVCEIALSQFHDDPTLRLLSVIDRNRDLHLSSVMEPRLIKVCSMVDSACWASSWDGLAAIADEKLLLWCCPPALMVDMDLLSKSKVVKDGSMFGRMPTIQTFNGTRVSVRKADGAKLTATLPPFTELLSELTSVNRWDESVRLARFAKLPQKEHLWAFLAAMALRAKHLDTAEVALAAIKAVETLHFVLHVRDLETEEERNAEFALLRKKPLEAERILLQASPPMLEKAIDMNIRLFRWERALDLAEKDRELLSRLLDMRQVYLKRRQKGEHVKRFLKLME